MIKISLLFVVSLLMSTSLHAQVPSGKGDNKSNNKIEFPIVDKDGELHVGQGQCLIYNPIQPNKPFCSNDDLVCLLAACDYCQTLNGITSIFCYEISSETKKVIKCSCIGEGERTTDSSQTGDGYNFPISMCKEDALGHRPISSEIGECISKSQRRAY